MSINCLSVIVSWWVIKLNSMTSVCIVSRPVESHSGARENIIAGPYHPPPPNSVCLEIGVEGEETWREVSPHHPTRGSGEHRKLPHRGPGQSPGRKWIYAYFRSKRSHLEHHFQYFWAMAGPPKRRGARENFPPFPPSRRAWLCPVTVITLNAWL